MDALLKYTVAILYRNSYRSIALLLGVVFLLYFTHKILFADLRSSINELWSEQL